MGHFHGWHSALDTLIPLFKHALRREAEKLEVFGEPNDACLALTLKMTLTDTTPPGECPCIIGFKQLPVAR
jgi:hypothetical protein